MIASDSTVIRTLRIKTTMPDRLAARQHTERALQAASLRPIGLPRDAILIVRHLTARRAGRAGWEQAVNAELDQLARQATRPIEGAVPANANAVLFTDRSELLACLAADWCAGVVRAQWWWQSLLRSEDIARAVIETWLAAPEYIPLALQRLSAHQQAIVFVQRLSDTHVCSIRQAVVQTFGLYELALTFAEINEMELIDREVMATSPDAVQVTPPWPPWVQVHVKHLSPDRQVLIAIGLMLTAAPSIVRSASFASEVKAWHAAIQALPQPAAPRTPVPNPTSPITPESTPTSVVQKMVFTLAAQFGESSNATASLPRTPAATKPSLPEQRAESVISEAAAYSAPGCEETNVSPAPQAAHSVTTALDDSSALPDLTPLPLIVETKFGGVCYFINLGLFLNLYGDFTKPLQPGLDLPIWDFMALVAQELLGEEVTRDPIWPLLAQLADRTEDEPPGLHFDPPEQASLSVWLAKLMSIIRPRLQLALGVNEEDLSRYFKQRARIVVSALNFDAYFALADLPIEIRLSGLDRDPGWVPAAGRTVRFHYD